MTYDADEAGTAIEESSKFVLLYSSFFIRHPSLYARNTTISRLIHIGDIIHIYANNRPKIRRDIGGLG